jgi:uncharacterized protein (DUF2164 family)
MSEIKFSKKEKSAIVARLKAYFANELDQDIGQFDAEFLLDFFSREIGPYYYNRALYDAGEILDAYVGSMKEALYVIEKETS